MLFLCILSRNTFNQYSIKLTLLFTYAILQNQMKTINTIFLQSNKYLKTSSRRENTDTTSSTTSTAQKPPEIEIAQLKKIAHKSFLQVMQAESLHQQQIKALQKKLEETTNRYQQKQKCLQNKIQELEKELNRFKSNFKEIQAEVLNFASEDLIIEEKNQCQGDISADFSHFWVSANKNFLEQGKQLQFDIFEEVVQYIPANEANIITQNILQIIEYYISSEMKSLNGLDLKRKNNELQSKLDNLQIKYEYSVKELKNLQNHIKSLDGAKRKLQSKNDQLKKKLKTYESEARSRTVTEQSLCSQSSASRSKYSAVLDPLRQDSKEKNNAMKNLFATPQQKFKRLKNHSSNSSHPSLRFIRNKGLINIVDNN